MLGDEFPDLWIDQRTVLAPAENSAMTDASRGEMLLIDHALAETCSASIGAVFGAFCGWEARGMAICETQFDFYPAAVDKLLRFAKQFTLAP